MNKIITIVCAIFIVSASNCKSKQEKSSEPAQPVHNTKKWTEFQGVMNWKEANAKCKGWFWQRSMKLPSKDDLLEAFKLGETEAWKKEGFIYWSSTPNGDDNAYAVYIGNGNANTFNRTENNFSVHCLR